VAGKILFIPLSPAGEGRGEGGYSFNIILPSPDSSPLPLCGIPTAIFF
jgi:hypothetical protein